MVHSPLADADGWVNLRHRRWIHPRSLLADADGWINPRPGRIPGGSRGRGRIHCPEMSDEQFKKRFIVSEADKALWEECVAEADREVKRLFGDDCLDPLSDEDQS